MDSVRRISAECQKYLLDIGIDPLVWVHAMETPRDQLFYFKPDELVRLKLSTGKADRARPARRAQPRSPEASTALPHGGPAWLPGPA